MNRVVAPEDHVEQGQNDPSAVSWKDSDEPVDVRVDQPHVVVVLVVLRCTAWIKRCGRVCVVCLRVCVACVSVLICQPKENCIACVPMAECSNGTSVCVILEGKMEHTAIALPFLCYVYKFEEPHCTMPPH